MDDKTQPAGAFVGLQARAAAQRADGSAGATPGEDISGLLNPRLTDPRRRDAAELEAISKAYEKYIFKRRRKPFPPDWFSDDFIRRSHLDMFGALWDWAGKYRTVLLNIGVEPHLIPEQIRALCGDFQFWNSAESKMPPLEIAARLQNRLTRIHPFKNGNGRHARFMTDFFLKTKNHPLPQWPQIQRLPQGDKIRAGYIAAMKKADGEDYKDLVEFMRNFLPNKETKK